MNNQLNYNAIMAWTAFGVQDYSGLEKYGQNVYNYFVHKPVAILELENPLLIGKVFQICLGFQEPDEDIQEVRAENAFLCFSQALKSDETTIHDEAAARLMMLLMHEQRHLINQVERACQNGYVNPYSLVSMLTTGLPKDMPLATNTKMLFTAYFLYNSVIDKVNVNHVFINVYEKKIFEYVENHVIDNCRQLTGTSPNRKVELGSIVFDKIYEKLQNDVEEYSKIFEFIP